MRDATATSGLSSPRDRRTVVIVSRRTVTALAVLLAVPLACPRAARGQPPARETVLVTNTADAGPGSLRHALAAGNRDVRFAPGVRGDIVLTRDIPVRGAFVTVDGSAIGRETAVTLRGHGIRVRGSNGAHDVTLRNLRIRDAAEDGIQIAAGAYNVLIENVSIAGSGDGNLDITQAGTRDVLVRSSVIGSPAGQGKNMLWGNRATGIRLLGNVVIDAPQRNPEVSYDQTDAERWDSGTTADLRHNVFWGWGRGRGPRIEEGSKANVIDNYFGGLPGTDLGDALIVCTGPATARTCSRDPRNVARAYTSGNVLHGSSIDLDARGTEQVPFPAPPVPSEGVCAAVERVVREAGAWPRDAIDRALIASIAPCTEALSP